MKAWQDKIWIGKLERMDAWMDLNTRVIKTLEYPLAVTNLMYDKSQVSFRLILDGGLLVGGMCRNMH